MSDHGLTCRELIEFLDDFIEGDLSTDVSERFESHMCDCPPCREYMETYCDTVRMTKSLCSKCDDPDAPPPDDVPEALIQAILKSRTKND